MLEAGVTAVIAYTYPEEVLFIQIIFGFPHKFKNMCKC
jgi:hypothetical protein